MTDTRHRELVDGKRQDLTPLVCTGFVLMDELGVKRNGATARGAVFF